ncbi:hypothetical protein K466DRAFT_579996 [Polyporus arcularius HHB13444]|uniref:Uncharacterized protein n=1 Tax=Polyporus arcularius HHB13444 TaxID=1314778 RepID=A0A5C3PZY6_9APHY|nr:hypothetical protein K466DRAFT_579996 [Polyporus arcularius HHB13444]
MSVRSGQLDCNKVGIKASTVFAKDSTEDHPLRGWTGAPIFGAVISQQFTPRLFAGGYATAGLRREELCHSFVRGQTIDGLELPLSSSAVAVGRDQGSNFVTSQVFCDRKGRDTTFAQVFDSTGRQHRSHRITPTEATTDYESRRGAHLQFGNLSS